MAKLRMLEAWLKKMPVLRSKTIFFKELDPFSLQKDIKKKWVHNYSRFLIFDFKIYTLSGAIKPNKPFVDT